MGEASRRGTYEQRKVIAIKKRQDKYITEGIKERNRIIAMTPEEQSARRKARNMLMMMSQWLPR